MAKKEERGFHYQKRGKDALKERANMKGGNFDSIFKPKFKVWKCKEGKNIIRILPPSWDNANHYGLDIFVNYSIGADNQSYLSLSKHNKGPDPIAEARREAQADGDKELAKKLSPSQRILYWIIDRNEEDEGPQLWAAPFTKFDRPLCNLCIDEDTKEVMYIDDPETGCDVRFYRTGTGLNTDYEASKMKVLKPGPIHEDEGLQTEWLDYISENTLPEVLNFYEYDHIKAVFDGGGPSKSEDDDDDETNTKTRRTRTDDEDEKPVRRSASKKADEVEEAPPRRRSAKGGEEDDDEDEAPPRKQHGRAADEDEDEKPAPRPRRRVAEPEADDDEVVEKPARRSRTEIDDDEEDESPPSTRRTKKSDDDEEGSGSLRERLAARRRSRSE